MSHSIDIALLWSADARRNRVLLTLGISIALIIHSLDLRWSENQTTKLHFSRLVIERKRNVACGKNYSDRDNGVLSSNTRHCTPLECRREEESCSIDITLRWSENQTTNEHFSRLVIERKRSVTYGKNSSDRNNGVLSSNTPHCTPLECGNVDIIVFY